MRIKDAAQRVGVCADWLRKLERDGRIPPALRDLNGHRRYNDEDLDKVRRILYAGGSLRSRAKQVLTDSKKGGK